MLPHSRYRLMVKQLGEVSYTPSSDWADKLADLKIDIEWWLFHHATVMVRDTLRNKEITQSEVVDILKIN